MQCETPSHGALLKVCQYAVFHRIRSKLAPITFTQIQGRLTETIFSKSKLAALNHSGLQLPNGGRQRAKNTGKIWTISKKLS